MRIEDLTDADKGRYVAYRPAGQPHTTGIGTIKHWNGVYVFVVFLGPKKYWESQDENAERWAMGCLPDTLRFVEKREDGGFNL